MKKIQVVSTDTCLNHYPRNLLSEVFEFRHEMIRRLGWSQGLTLQRTPITGVFTETDDQDKPGTTYFSKRGAGGNLIGVIRVSQSVDRTGRPISMIHQAFNNLVDPKIGMPHAQDVWETSRILIDLEQYTSAADRTAIVDELICATFFFAHQQGIKALFCFMAEGLWRSTYQRIGLEVERLGQNAIIEDKRTYNVYAGLMHINADVISRISRNTGLSSEILDYGYNPIGLSSASNFSPQYATLR